MKKYFHWALIGLSIILLLATISLIIIQIYGNQLIDNAGRNEDWDEHDGTVLKDQSYGHKVQNTYDLYIPTTAPKALMLYIHGGSWVSGNKEEGEWFCRRFAKQGYATATMNYSLLSPKDPSVCMPVMLKEISQCIHRINEQLNENGHNITQMAIAGYSAGAHLALLYANKDQSKHTLPIRFCINMVGPTDLRYLFKIPQTTLDSINADTRAGRIHPEKEKLEALAFYAAAHVMSTSEQCTTEFIDSLLFSASPVKYINEGTTPCILAYGANDHLIAKEHYDTLLNALTAHNIEHEFILYPNSNHLLANDTLHTRKLNEAIKAFANKYFK
jgi:acetyl esterase/lipase